MEARRALAQIPPLTKRFGAFSLDQAYDIQKVLTRTLQHDLGPVIGYKMAYASKSSQKQFGIAAPASAPLFLLQQLPSGTDIRKETFSDLEKSMAGKSSCTNSFAETTRPLFLRL